MTTKKKTHEEFIKEMNEIHPNLEFLEKYTDSKTKIKYQCKIDGCINSTTPNVLLKRSGCPVCGRRKTAASWLKSHETFIEEMKQLHPDIKVIGQYTKAKEKIKCECLIDGHQWFATPNNLLRGRKCPVCSNKTIISGYNDLLTLRPDLDIYIVDKELAKNIAVYSTTKILCKCPDCGILIYKNVANLSNRGFSCPSCGDGISYPNKFLYSFIKQLNVKNCEFEWSPEWAGLYRYDSYFEFNEQKYIIEMDGAFHYNEYNNLNTSLEERQRIDKLKDELAFKHDIKLIRINAMYSSREYIANNILSSELNNIFNLNHIDWLYCDKMATANIIKQVCDLYNQGIPIKEICVESYKCCEDTIREYLHIGTKLGFCNYKAMNKKSIDVYTLQNVLLYHFSSIAECCRELSDLYSITYAYDSVSRACKNLKPYKNFMFKYSVA